VFSFVQREGCESDFMRKEKKRCFYRSGPMERMAVWPRQRELSQGGARNLNVAIDLHHSVRGNERVKLRFDCA
jgi:hypothetical protein